MNRREELATNLASVQERITRSDVTLIVVTKTYPVSDVQALKDLGVENFGENRSEEGEAAGDEQHLHADRLAGVDQRLGARVDAQAFDVHPLHVGHGHAAQQRHALAQAFLVVGDLAAHGGFGDGGHFGLAAGGVGDFVHTLDVDERGVHVERDELEVLEFQRRREALNGEAGGEFGGG